MAGAMHKLTAAIHRNMFAVVLLGGRTAQVTSENVSLDLHMEREEGKLMNKGAIGANKVTNMSVFASAWGSERLYF